MAHLKKLWDEFDDQIIKDCTLVYQNKFLMWGLRAKGTLTELKTYSKNRDGGISEFRRNWLSIVC